MEEILILVGAYRNESTKRTWLGYNSGERRALWQRLAPRGHVARVRFRCRVRTLRMGLEAQRSGGGLSSGTRRRVVAVTGSGSFLGRNLVLALEEDERVERV